MVKWKCPNKEMVKWCHLFSECGHVLLRVGLKLVAIKPSSVPPLQIVPTPHHSRIDLPGICGINNVSLVHVCREIYSSNNGWLAVLNNQFNK